MAEHPGFLEAVVAAPDDDTPRLIYADWLDEQGESARAEHIRLSCRQAAVSPFSPEGRWATERLGELEQEHAARWFGPIKRYASGYTVLRGFVEGVVLRRRQLFHWGRLLQMVPTLRRATLRKVGGGWLQFVTDEPGSSRLERLSVGRLDLEGLARLADWPHLTKLRLLRLHETTVDDVIVLLGSRTLPITRVELEWYGEGHDDA